MAAGGAPFGGRWLPSSYNRPMDRADLGTLLDYHYWARDRILAAVAPLSPEQFTRNLGSSFASIRDTLAHAYAAEYAWYARWHGTSPAALLPADQFPDLETLRRAWTEHEAKMRAFVDGLDEVAVNRVVEYRFLSGQPAATILWQMVQHVVNHGSYHRGQVTTMLRQLGAAPPRSMDMIEYYRKHPTGPRAGATVQP
jgi:uncharacterized damage-inducible protein DinB